MRHRLTVTASTTVAMCLLALALVVTAETARAHDGLVGSEPADAAVLTSAPSQVVLTFSADQLAVGSAVLVNGPDGASWSDGDSVVVGPTVTQALRPGLPSGAYQVHWRSVAGDGHPVEGTFGFTVDAAGTGPEPAEPAEVTQDPEEPAEARAPLLPTEPSDGSGDAQAMPGDAVGSGPMGWLVAVTVATALAVAAVLVARRRGQGPG